jgi:hypothetical protein
MKEPRSATAVLIRPVSEVGRSNPTIRSIGLEAVVSADKELQR